MNALDHIREDANADIECAKARLELAAILQEATNRLRALGFQPEIRERNGILKLCCDPDNLVSFSTAEVPVSGRSAAAMFREAMELRPRHSDA